MNTELGNSQPALTEAITNRNLHWIEPINDNLCRANWAISTSTAGI